MEQLWSMYNRVEQLRIDDLKTEHVRIILLSIPNSRMSEWYVCREGDLQWSAITDISDFYEDVHAPKGLANLNETAKDLDATVITPAGKKPSGPPRPQPEEVSLVQKAPIKQAFVEAPKPLSKEDLEILTTKVQERRTARRYARNFNFEVKKGEKVFKCVTVDISMNGISLSENVPGWLEGKAFRATLTHKKDFIRVQCEVVRGAKLKMLEADSWDLIRKWIVNG